MEVVVSSCVLFCSENEVVVMCWTTKINEDDDVCFLSKWELGWWWIKKVKVLVWRELESRDFCVLFIKCEIEGFMHRKKKLEGVLFSFSFSYNITFQPISTFPLYFFFKLFFLFQILEIVTNDMICDWGVVSFGLSGLCVSLF